MEGVGVVDVLDEFEGLGVVNEHLPEYPNEKVVAEKLDGHDFCRALDAGDLLAAFAVPQDDCVDGPERGGTATHERHDVCPVEYFNYFDSFPEIYLKKERK